MFLRTNPRFSRRPSSFNMTALIDIVFLLIIFFLVVSRFIEAENFDVVVPDGCDFAQSQAEASNPVTTVTVVENDEGKIDFAVNAEKISASGYDNLVQRLAEMIDERLVDLPSNDRVVTLRIDKDICFSHAQYALAGIAVSSATDIRLAALKDKQPGSQ